MQTLVKRRDVRKTKDAVWFSTGKGTAVSISSVMGRSSLSAYREGLSYCVSPAEQGKPVFLLSRKGSRKATDGNAGNRGGRKRKPLCSGVDTGYPDCASRQTSLWSFPRENLSN